LRYSVLCIFLFCAYTLQSQNAAFDLELSVLDADTEETLAYATVYNTTQGIGTATNLDGAFSLPACESQDTIIVSYIGYTTDTLYLNEILPLKIRLKTNTQSFAEVVVTASDDLKFLYDLVSGLETYHDAPARTAKTYYFLETFLNDQRVETLESYYNGTYTGYDVQQLLLKKGRIGLGDNNGRYYLSTETSKTFRYHSLFKGNYLFPDNPLSVSKGKLRRLYKLNLRYRTIEQGREVYVIDFIPKKKKRKYYGGSLWIDVERNCILKTTLNIENAEIFPFRGIALNRILSMDMEITKNYIYDDHAPQLSTMDFNYTVYYEDALGHKQMAHTQAYIAAFNYNELFKLPRFNFSETIHEDYRNITLAPYDAMFWKQNLEFRLYEERAEVDQFIEKNVLSGTFVWPASSADQQLQYPYIHWDHKRLMMREASAKKIHHEIETGKHRSERYQLGIKLYMDINESGESLSYRLISILDPVETYYHIFITPADRIYMNLQFDLMEIERRELDSRLKMIPELTRDTINELYDQAMEHYRETIASMVIETKHGKNSNAMITWNEQVNRKLGINNRKLFQSDEKESIRN